MKSYLNKFKSKTNFLIIILSILLNSLVNIKIYQNAYSPILIVIWMTSITFLLLPFLPKINPRFKFSRKSIFIIIMIFLPTIVRVFNLDIFRIHGDEFLPAYFSATINFKKTNFFAPIPVNRDDWVCQFPSIYFFLQKIFFIFLGENPLAVKLSIMPYVFVTSLMIYLLVNKIFNEKIAFISLLLYSFFAVSLYLETLGLHFISSTAIFMIFFYFLLLSKNFNKLFYTVMAGIFCGFCYLSYISSYIALILLIIFSFIGMIRYNKIIIVKNFLISLISFFIVISPFLTYMIKNNNYYFRGRINQVSLLSGDWSSVKTQIDEGKSYFTAIKENLIISLKSIYIKGVGGHGGYWFGHLAFFEKLTLLLFIWGLVIAIFLIFKKTEILFILLTILISFFLGMVLTIPPPAYHRLSLSFPFLTIIMSLPFYHLLSLKRKSSRLINVLIFVLLLSYLINNEKYFRQSTKSDTDQSLELSYIIKNNFPGRSLYIAAFPNFAFEKIFYFIENKKGRKVLSDYHQSLLDKFNREEKYIYVIIPPREFDQLFSEKDKNGKLIHFSDSYSLFFN